MGIHAGPKGAYSIALSGGYEDDVDMGDCFTYTGEGTYRTKRLNICWRLHISWWKIRSF